MKDSIIREVGNKVFELNDDEKVRDQIEREMDAKILYKNGLKYAREDGYDDGYDNGVKVGYDSGVKVGYDSGIKEGYDNGAAETKISIVKNLLQIGSLSIKEIAELTNLEEDEVLAIQEKLIKEKQ